MSESEISFTVKELIVRIDGKIDTMTNLLHSKADQEALARVDLRLADVEKRGSENARIALQEAQALSARVNEINSRVATRAELEESIEKMREQETQNRHFAWGIAIAIISSMVTMGVELIHFFATRR